MYKRRVMSKKAHSKAFTLTELLVVVVVVGVLAGVGIPKFNQVMETRRTGEAESLMAAIRSEQEKRCSFDKPYAESFDKLPGVISVNNPDKNKTRTSSGNYTYYLEGSGISAQSNRRDYQIKMPSYASGGLCCSGGYCGSLNKNYVACGATPADGCATEVPGCHNPVYAAKPENACECEPTSCRCPAYAAANPCLCAKQCDPGQITTSACSQCGTQKKVCDSSCQWPSSWDTGGCSNTKSCSCSSFGLCGTPSVASTCGTCSSTGCVSCCSGCSGSGTETEYEYNSESQSCNSCGTQTRSASRTRTRTRTCDCSSWSAWGAWSSWGAWNWGNWGTCSVSSASDCAGDECTNGQTKGSQTCNTCGTQTTQKCINGYWTNALGSCSVASASECSKDCPEAGKPESSCNKCGTRSVTCDTKTGVWQTGTCSKTEEECKTPCPASCPYGQKPGTVSFSEDGACCVPKKSCMPTCPSGSTRTTSDFEEDGACCKAEEYTYTNVMYKAIESGCSGAGYGTFRICTGSVSWDKTYTDFQLTRCENRTGATCQTANWYWLFGAGGNTQNGTGAARCNGGTMSLPDCTSLASNMGGIYLNDICTKRGYEGDACILTYYSRGCTQVGTKPCVRDGDYCRNLESDRDGGRIAAAHDVMVMKCVRK